MHIYIVAGLQLHNLQHVVIILGLYVHSVVKHPLTVKRGDVQSQLLVTDIQSIYVPMEWDIRRRYRFFISGQTHRSSSRCEIILFHIMIEKY